MERTAVDTIIISDLHLGSDLSRAEDAVRMLKRYSFRRLILLGDIFCDLNFARLKKDHWKLLSYIRKLSNPKRGIEVVWVEGNHDQGLTHVMSHLVGVRVYQQYAWQFGAQKCLAIHGHQFDRFVVNNELVSRFGAWIYLLLQKMDVSGKHLSRFLDRLNSAWLRLTPKVAAGALAHAKAHGADLVFCGHTHEATHSEAKGVNYYNTGCWISSNPTYVTVGEEGVQVHVYQQRSDHRDTSEERGEVAAEALDFAFDAGLDPDGEYESIRC